MHECRCLCGWHVPVMSFLWPCLRLCIYDHAMPETRTSECVLGCILHRPTTTARRFRFLARIISVFYAFRFYVRYCMLCVFSFSFFFLFLLLCVCFVICCRHGEAYIGLYTRQYTPCLVLGFAVLKTGTQCPILSTRVGLRFLKQQRMYKNVNTDGSD